MSKIKANVRQVISSMADAVSGGRETQKRDDRDKKKLPTQRNRYYT